MTSSHFLCYSSKWEAVLVVRCAAQGLETTPRSVLRGNHTGCKEHLSLSSNLLPGKQASSSRPGPPQRAAALSLHLPPAACLCALSPGERAVGVTGSRGLGFFPHWGWFPAVGAESYVCCDGAGMRLRCCSAQWAGGWETPPDTPDHWSGGAWGTHLSLCFLASSAGALPFRKSCWAKQSSVGCFPAQSWVWPKGSGLQTLCDFLGGSWQTLALGADSSLVPEDAVCWPLSCLTLKKLIEISRSL